MQRLRYIVVATFIVLVWCFHAFDNGSVRNISTMRNGGTTTFGKLTGKPRIAILTMTTQQSSYLYMSLKNKWKYSETHGYNLIVDYDIKGESAVWHKLNMMDAAIDSKKYDWIWWIDFDTLVTNMTIKLEDIIHDALSNTTATLPQTNKIDWLLTADCFPLNAGSMILRSTPQAKTMIQNIRNYGNTHPKLSEQDCLQKLIEENKNGEKERVVMIPQWKINAFPEENACYDKGGRAWRKGDFVIHLAGAWAYLKNSSDPYGEMMKRYEGHVIWPTKMN